MNTDPTPQHPGRRKKIALGCGITMLLVITLTVLAFSYENWSGAREWARVREKLVQAGVELNPKSLLAELPPPGKNFGASPMIFSLTQFSKSEEGEFKYAQPEQVERFRRMRLPDLDNRVGIYANWIKQESADLKSLASELERKGEPGEEILMWMQAMKSEMAEVDQAAKLPEAVIPFDLADDFLGQMATALPHVQDFMKFQKFQSIRVCAALEAGDHEQARSGIRTMLQTGRVAGSQPLLISHLVQVTCYDQVLSVVWHGLNAGHWNEEDLLFLEAELKDESDALLENLEIALNLEMCVMTIGAFDFLKTPDARGVDLVSMIAEGGANRRVNHAIFFVPDGIWDHNKAFAAEWMFDDALGPAMRREVPKENSRFTKSSRTPRNLIAKIIVPAVSNVGLKTYRAAVAVDLARVALATERFQIANGSYPSRMDELSPDFLRTVPLDRFSDSGESLRYFRSGERYTVYSVGMNRMDEKGLRVFKSPKRIRLDTEKGDLAWGYETP